MFKEEVHVPINGDVALFQIIRGYSQVSPTSKTLSSRVRSL